MYDPRLEKDSCGVGFAAHIKGRKSRRIIDMALESLRRLEHRGAVGADPDTGDGSGLLMQIPDAFFRRVIREEKKKLPPLGSYGIGFVYLPQAKAKRLGIQSLIEKVMIDEGLEFIAWRDVPVEPKALGESARRTLPYMRQCFIGAPADFEKKKENLSFEQKLYLVRRVIDRRVRAEYKLDRSQYYVASFSSRTIVYKGMLTAEQLTAFYPDLGAEDMSSALALIHQRYSTNTFPTWDLAQPFRMIAHNGEINTVRGNQNWMMARQMLMESKVYGKNMRRMLPVIMEGQSDSATFDTVFELLCMAGREMSHAMMMMIPEAWSKKKDMSEELRAFYEYHAAIMEPWDGPAAIAFSDGEIIGATLDRNGLRPGRYVITKDDIVLMASEAGTISIDPKEIVRSERLHPGRMFLINTRSGSIIQDEAIKESLSRAQNYKLWIKENMIRLEQLPNPSFVHQPDHTTIRERQRAFGYSNEDLSLHLRPMAVYGQEATGSMGVDSALAILAEEPFSLFRYFKQQFAQVTNPAIDSLREEMVMELKTYIGPEGNLLDESPEHAHRLELEIPILTNKDLEKIRHIKSGRFRTKTINTLFGPDTKHGMRKRLEQVQDEAAEAVRKGYSLIVLSDRGVSVNTTPIPSLLAVSAVHHSLIKAGLRTGTGLVIESGEPREVFHFALLLGYGVNAVNPYLAFETLADMQKENYLTEVKELKEARNNYMQAINKGLLKIFSKMGISTLQSYCGAQIFEALGLDSELVNLYFCGTQSKIEGLSLEMLEEECLRRHRQAYSPFPHEGKGQLPSGSIHHYRKYGVQHLLDPLTIHYLQEACRHNDYELYKQYAQKINEQKEKPITLRSLFRFKYAKRALPLEEVEEEGAILKRFSTGAMSFGSISWEAHTDLAIAMNEIGAKSNTGEGGEDPIRFLPQPDGRNMRSAIKQIASGRFGVNTHYLVNADDIQIKISQGAKPGEGGQLPGHKVDQYIAKLRFSTPGLTLISPPPHHDIYSIEDIKQLIFDLKNVNPKARISVKLVSESGVGTVAAGVAKAHADHIHISGYSGGTGASPLSSIHHAGTPWELGLSETHQTLLIQGLRDRIYLGVDGKMLTGRDIVIAALFGAEEFSFSVAPLISLGCIMMRKCHLNTCPVGIATQNTVLRERYQGKAEYVIHYMRFIAREVREIMAALGIARFNELIGQIDRLYYKAPSEHWKARGLDLSRLLTKPQPAHNTGLYRTREQKHDLDAQLDKKIIARAQEALGSGKKTELKIKITNRDRSVGAMLAGEIARRYGLEGLPRSTICVEMEGIAGQSFAAFINSGIDFRLWGQANDYVGKGMCGGFLVIRLPRECEYEASENIIIGNTCFYGATGGEAYCEGAAGERFCVRNSGLDAVVEGLGDHACEYMTGGRVVVLGKTGRNFGAGMSGGFAYVYDPESNFSKNLNPSMVELEALNEESEEEEKCLEMIRKHYEYTGSKRAGFLIENWERESGNFLRVVPKEYKKLISREKEEKSRALGQRVSA